MKAGTKLVVFSVRPPARNDGASVWVKAGTAWVNRDGSLNVYLDVLPLDGKLHIREALSRPGDEPKALTVDPLAEKPE